MAFVGRLHEQGRRRAPPHVALGTTFLGAHAGVGVLRAHIEHLDVHFGVSSLKEFFVVTEHLGAVGAVDHDHIGGGTTGEDQAEHPEGMFHDRDFLRCSWTTEM